MNSFLEKLRKRNKTDYIILILLGVLVMIIAVPTKEKQEENASEKTEELTSQTTEDDYKAKLEKQLENLIEKMNGAGKAKVMITFSDEGYTYLDKNLVTDEKKKEETTVVYDTGDGETPYVVRKERPQVEGVVVVAQGGDDPAVVTEISSAVMSLFHLEVHKVIVVKMSVQEE